MTRDAPGGVVALVAAKDRADTVGATVEALLGVPGVAEVLVVDDGSTDATAAAASAAGARVLRLPLNVGKGGAVRAGVAAAPHAAVYLLADADLGATAGRAGDLLVPVLSGDADLSIAVLPPAGRRGGLGGVRRLAAAGIGRATGGRFRPRAPLSGQRAVRGELLRSLALAERFGLETAMTIDAVRAGWRVVEVDVAMDHRHTGRTFAGFRHRAVQGAQIVRALWPRLTTAAQRVGVVVVCSAVLGTTALWSGAGAEPASVAASDRPSRVVVVGVPKLGLDDVGTGRMPTLDRLARRGAVAATSVRTQSSRPTTTEGYATLGAGARVRADEWGGYAFDAATPLEGGTAAQALARRTGRTNGGEVAVVGAAVVRRLNEGRHLPSAPGALGEALRRAGRVTAVVGNADLGGRPLPGRSARLRPAAAAVMDAAGWVAVGTVGPQLVEADPGAPFGVRADPAAVGGAVRRALGRADVVLVDGGDTERAAEFTALATPAAAARARRAALASADRLLADVVAMAGPDTLVLVVSVSPPTADLHLTPMVAAGPGVAPGYLHSPSTRRLGVVTLTDVAPTILDALGVTPPAGMIGHPLRYHEGDGALDRLRRIDRDATFREALYFPLTVGHLGAHAVVYGLALAVLWRLGRPGRLAGVVRWGALALAAWPLATFLLRALPGAARLGAGAVVALVLLDAAVVAAAARWGRRPLGPLALVCGATVALLVADLATGGRLQASSILGYSYNTAARFTGLGNTAFGVLAACAVLAAALHVHHAPRRREALVSASCLLALVVLADGAPALGSDVGGILTLVPVFLLLLLALAGRRPSLKAVALAALAAVALAGLAAAVDLLRPPAARTHLGRLVAEVAEEGFEPLTTVVARKAAANLRSLASPWAWMLPIAGAYAIAVAAWLRARGGAQTPGAAVRAGAIGLVGAAALGYAVNDSGVVVSGLVLVYLGPLLTLLALERVAAAEPVLVEPAGPSARPAAPRPGHGRATPRLAANQ